MNCLLPEAVSRLSLERFREVLRSAEDVEARDAKGRTALFRAARIGRVAHAGLLLRRGADPNAVDSFGEAPLQAAVRYGHLQSAKLLIDAGAVVNYCPPPETTEFSETALCSAVRKAGELVSYLLACGADPNACSSARRLPLIVAVENERPEIVSMLLEAGARVNEQDKQGSTALHAAVEAGSVPMIKLLLSHGADPELQANHVGTVLCAALFSKEHDPAALVLALLPARPNLAAVCPSWEMTPIELARQFDLPEVEELLNLVGQQQPSSDSGSDDDFQECDEESGQAFLEIRFISHRLPEPSASDRELAERICEGGPTLSRNLGWRSSPAHWLILSILARMPDPIELPRIAYFFRGFLNAPAGEELKDGPRFLGEPYQDAVLRFVEEGFVAEIRNEEQIAKATPADRLKGLAREHGLNVSGKKQDLVKRLVALMGFGTLCDHLKPTPRFSILPAGVAVLNDRKKNLAEARTLKRQELLDLLSDGEFEWACHIGRELGLLCLAEESRIYQATAERMASRIALTRKLLSLPSPPSLEEFSPLEKPLRTICAAICLTGDTESHWWDWDSRILPIHSLDGDLFTPIHFRNLILSQDCD